MFENAQNQKVGIQIAQSQYLEQKIEGIEINQETLIPQEKSY